MPKIEKRDYPPGDFTGRWRDYNVYTKLSPSAKKYITAVNKNTGKQLRRYEYVKALLEDEDIPNSIEELNKMVSQGSMELQGEVQELAIEEYLAKNFAFAELNHYPQYDLLYFQFYLKTHSQERTLQSLLK